MAKRGYKLQEFVAHSGSVSCLSIGKKTGRLFVSGGEDHKVNLWSIGKPTSLMSLCGHTSPVESVTFDSADVLVAAGASTGVIKIWDLEETKMVRTLAGHRSNCTAVEFHPFGEFFASGSTDTNLKVWDIRKKSCIHTYKGHTRGISTIRFTPDGRWIVSGGLDNVVKIWDLTAGKLLHDFKFHEGHIRSIDFHPLEFLLATGSADRTVKYWDLETFELIGASRPEAAGVRSIKFHPDGRSLFCGFDDSLKVYSWEPVICHDTVDMGWSTLGDLCIHDGKLLGCSYYRNSVGVWVADISLIEPYGGGLVPEKNSYLEPKYDTNESPIQKMGGHRWSASNLRSMSPDFESREIKNIYVDTAGSTPVVPKKVGSINTPKVALQSDSKEVRHLSISKQGPAVGLRSKSAGQANNKSFVVPNVVLRDGTDSKDFANPRRESLTARRISSGMSQMTNVRRSPVTKIDMERLSPSVQSGSTTGTTISLDTSTDKSFINRVLTDDDYARDSYDFEEKQSSDIEVEEKFEKVVFFDREKFEKVLSTATASNSENGDESVDSSKGINSVKVVNGVTVVQGRTRSLVEKFERRETLNNEEAQTPDTAPQTPQILSEADKSPPSPISEESLISEESKLISEKVSKLISEKVSKFISAKESKLISAKESKLISAKESKLISEKESKLISEKEAKLISEKESKLNGENEEQMQNHDVLVSTLQVRERESKLNDENVLEDLMQNHDMLLSTLRSRLTKLQVVRHFWERKDIKGAINAMRKLPDHSVSADVISVVMEKMEILNLDLFSFLLPVLLNLLNSEIERHTNVSLEMLLKLVAVFGSVVHATISAPPLVGVDLQAEQRLECCNRCFSELQKIQKILPTLFRRGGVVAKSARELNLVLLRES